MQITVRDAQNLFWSGSGVGPGNFHFCYIPGDAAADAGTTL